LGGKSVDDALARTENAARMRQEVLQVVERDGVPIIDAVVEWAGRNGVEIETAAQMVKRSAELRSRLEDEAVARHSVRRDPNQGERLPV
jgi:hypothetical protein